MTDLNYDPFATFAFTVKLNGKDAGYFQEVSGLGAQIDIEEVQEGGRNNTTRKLVGQGKFPNIVFKRGFCNETFLDAVMNFHTAKERIDGVIEMRSVKKDVIATWEFKNGIPVKWDGPQLNVSQNAIAVESLEIAHEGLVAYTISKVDRTGTKGSTKSGPASPPPAKAQTSGKYSENNNGGSPNAASAYEVVKREDKHSTSLNGADTSFEGSINDSGFGQDADTWEVANSAASGGGDNISDLGTGGFEVGELNDSGFIQDADTWEVANSAVSSGGENISNAADVIGGLGGAQEDSGFLQDADVWEVANSAVSSGGGNISNAADVIGGLGGAQEDSGFVQEMLVNDAGGIANSSGLADAFEDAQNSAVSSGGVNISDLGTANAADVGSLADSGFNPEMLSYGNAAELLANAADLGHSGGDEE